MKTALVVSALMSACTGHAQQVDLLVFQDMKPGQWASMPTKIPKGLEAFMKPEVDCWTAKKILDFKQDDKKSLAKYGCSQTLITNTPTTAVTKLKCVDQKSGFSTESTTSIIREADNTWTHTMTGPDASGVVTTTQTTMKYLNSQCTAK